jgi:hypothetical protein
MSIRGGHPDQRGPGRPAEIWWILLVLAAALVGGLAAAALVHASLIMAVVVSVVAAAIAVLALRMAPAVARGPETFGSAPVVPPPGSPADPSPPPPPPPTAPAQAPAFGAPEPGAPRPAFPAETVVDGPPAPAETVVEMLPLPPPPGEGPRPAGAPWWDPAPGAPPRPSAGAKRVPAPDLTTYLASTLIAQCPRCGAFRLDIRQAGDAWDFRCEDCEHAWAWRPGTAWPPVRVTPGLRRQPHPPAS